MSTIIVSRQLDVTRQVIERLDYRWEGKESTVRVSMDLFPEVKPEVGTRFNVGPFRLRVMEVEWVAHRFNCVRIDSLNGQLHYYWHRCNRGLDIIYRRLIMMAVIWGLARYDHGTIPSWRDLIWFKKAQQ